MRQSLSEQRMDQGVQKRQLGPLPGALIWAALATAVLVLVVTVIDQMGSQSLYGFTEAAYGSHGVALDPGAVYAILYATAVTVTLLWGVLRLLSRSRGWRAPVLSAVVTVVTGTAATLLLTATEYGEHVFSPVWGLMTLVPTALGVVVTILLVRDARR